ARGAGVADVARGEMRPLFSGVTKWQLDIFRAQPPRRGGDCRNPTNPPTPVGRRGLRSQSPLSGALFIADDSPDVDRSALRKSASEYSPVRRRRQPPEFGVLGRKIERVPKRWH
ncbi:MAG: hypothetical protein ACLFWL_18140, partial [Candidatus Brocadiia bacterium]